MSEEIVDTNPDIFPEGTFVFTCNQVIKKKTDKGNVYYIFEFEGVAEGETRVHKEFRMAWQAGDLILALGGKETEKKGVYKWDREAVKGNKIKAEVVHEADRKDASKTRAKLQNAVEELPF